MKLYFVPKLLPRTWSKAQWKAAWQWVRVKRQDLKRDEEIKTEWLRNPDLDPRLRQDLMNELIYPPLLLGPGMESA